MTFENTLAHALELDTDDKLRHFRTEFHIPHINGTECIYFCGNSLGLQPKAVRSFVEQELKDWAELGVEGHFRAKNPWLHYHKPLAAPLAHIAGALEHEVVAMNALTVNLHLLMATFYRPTQQRYKILTEAGAFSSDHYALESQAIHHGLIPDKTIIEVAPRKGEHIVRTEDIVQKIEELGDSLALVMMGGVNFYTGQVFDMQTITAAAHKAGAYAGFDLAHAIGNIELQLHNWQVDFATWCSYKYLNSGPGGVSGIYIHENFSTDISLPRFAGWWGHNEATRFRMEKGFVAIPTADAWQLSNAPVLSMAAHKASLELFEKAGMVALIEKSRKLTAYLEFLLKENGLLDENSVELITPANPSERGCQLSLLMKKDGRRVFEGLEKAGVIADWREPDVIRLAPVPLYNTFKEVYRFVEIFKELVKNS